MLKNRIGRVLLVTGLAGALLGVTLAGAAPAASPPVGDWKMDTGSGTVLVDSSASGNNGTILGNPTWVDRPARSGAPFRRTGTPTDYATVPDNASLDISTAITMAAWVKPEQGGHHEPDQEGDHHAGRRSTATSSRCRRPGCGRRCSCASTRPRAATPFGSTRRPRIRSTAPPGCTWRRPTTERRSGCT